MRSGLQNAVHAMAKENAGGTPLFRRVASIWSSRCDDLEGDVSEVLAAVAETLQGFAAVGMAGDQSGDPLRWQSVAEVFEAAMAEVASDLNDVYQELLDLRRILRERDVDDEARDRLAGVDTISADDEPAAEIVYEWRVESNTVGTMRKLLNGVMIRSASLPLAAVHSFAAMNYCTHLEIDSEPHATVVRFTAPGSF